MQENEKDMSYVLDLAKIRDLVRRMYPEESHIAYALAQQEPEAVYDYVKEVLLKNHTLVK